MKVTRSFIVIALFAALMLVSACAVPALSLIHI